MKIQVRGVFLGSCGDILLFKGCWTSRFHRGGVNIQWVGFVSLGLWWWARRDQKLRDVGGWFLKDVGFINPLDITWELGSVLRTPPPLEGKVYRVIVLLGMLDPMCLGMLALVPRLQYPTLGFNSTSLCSLFCTYVPEMKDLFMVEWNWVRYAPIGYLGVSEDLEAP